MNTIKSKQRVADHGEIFTRVWMGVAMLDLVQDFHLLVRLKVFNTGQMNQAVFAFRRYEDASLRARPFSPTYRLCLITCFSQAGTSDSILCMCNWNSTSQVCAADANPGRTAPIFRLTVLTAPYVSRTDQPGRRHPPSQAPIST
jgi:hypothetical protein